MGTDKSAKELSEELGVNRFLLYEWRREFKKKGEVSFSGNGKKNLTPQEAEIARLKKELREAARFYNLSYFDRESKIYNL